jgi:topoisomerase-4 subunit A
MDEEEENIFPYEEKQSKPSDEKHFYENEEDANDTITKVTGMYKDWFLDYASYVILERAVPAIEDGFKPVQRRIMHSLKELDDGRYNKVANVVGHTMQYHPHGDQSIADAMVQIGQRELLIDCQGNWGNILPVTARQRQDISRHVCQNLPWKFYIHQKSLIGEFPMMVVVQNLIIYP